METEDISSQVVQASLMEVLKAELSSTKKELSQAAAELGRLKSSNLGLLAKLGFENKTGQHKTPKEV